MTERLKKARLAISAECPRELCGCRAERARGQFNEVKPDEARAATLFLAETIEFLSGDEGEGDKAQISCTKFDEPDDAGSLEWRIYNDDFSAYRKLVRTKYMGPRGVVTEDDVTNIVCPYERMSAEWNGEWGAGGRAMRLTLDGVTENEAKVIDKLAREFFVNVEVERSESENYFHEAGAPAGRRAITDIYEAAMRGGLDDVIGCVEKGAAPDEKNADSKTPLMLVCERSDERDEIAEYLLDKGANARTGDQYKKSALMAACAKGHAAIAAMLLKKGAKVQTADIIGTLAIHEAAGNGHADVVRLLLKNGAAADVKDGTKYTALHLAAMHGHLEAVRALVEGGAGIMKKDGDGRAAIDMAKENRHAKVAEYLEAALKTSPEERRGTAGQEKTGGAAEGETEKSSGGDDLIAAASRADVSKIKALIAAGADVNYQKNNGQTALSILCSRTNCDAEAVGSLIAAGAKAGVQDKNGNTALHYAAEKNNLEAARTLLNAGCDPNVQNRMGETALYVAAFKRAQETAFLLVERGADISKTNMYGRDAMTAAAAAGDQRMALHLLSYGADVNLRPSGGWNAMIYAAQNGLNGLAEEMIKRGADVNYRDNEGRTALIFAVEQKNWLLLGILLKAGADPEIAGEDGINAVDRARFSWNREKVLKALAGNCGPALREKIAGMEFAEEKLEVERERKLAEQIAEYKRNNAPVKPPLPEGFQPSIAFRNFYESFFGDPYMAWHDGLDMGSIDRLTGEERELAEELLLSHGDHRASAGLGQLKSQKSAETLKKNLLGAPAAEIVNSAVALKKIENDDSYCKYIIHVLKNCRSEYDRLEAAMALRDFGTEESIAALYEAIRSDPDYLVRYHACNSLLKLHGVDKDISEYRDIFRNIITKDGEPVTEEDTKRFEAAGEELKKMFRK